MANVAGKGIPESTRKNLPRLAMRPDRDYGTKLQAVANKLIRSATRPHTTS